MIQSFKEGEKEIINNDDARSLVQLSALNIRRKLDSSTHKRQVWMRKPFALGATNHTRTHARTHARQQTHSRIRAPWRKRSFVRLFVPSFISWPTDERAKRRVFSLARSLAYSKFNKKKREEEEQQADRKLIGHLTLFRCLESDLHIDLERASPPFSCLLDCLTVKLMMGVTAMVCGPSTSTSAPSAAWLDLATKWVVLMSSNPSVLFGLLLFI